MPIPKPRKGDKPESQSDFMGRCMGDSTMMNDYPKQDQRLAVCFSAYRDAHPGAAKPKDIDPATLEEADEIMAVTADAHIKWMPTLLNVKGLNEGERTIMGIATTPTVDHMGDIVESMGAKYKEPVSIPLLWMHRHDQPVGTVTHVTKSE